VVAADDPRAGHSGWTPVPDPTALTTEQLRRELSGLREILTARLDGMDRATALLSETVNRTPTVIQTEISHLRELIDEKVIGLGDTSSERLKTVDRRISDSDVRYQQQFSERDLRFQEEFKGVAEKFTSIELQFKERDTRTEQAAKAGKEALDAALLSAKELVAQQNEANRGEAAKTEQNFTKQIDAQAARIDELKERIDRGEGSTTGSAEFRAARRLDVGQALQAIVTVAALITLLIVLFHR
jgi:hypothetical protein